MKRRLFEKHADSGSALILTLLITALLTATVVGFLSTARIEQLAARNFSQQNAASGLAELATQQAMAKIQQGFNATGNGTSVITTQPGAINKYFFSNGTLQSNQTITTELFSTGSGNLSYLNNLQNPSSNSNATTDQWTITGNASERINVPMENITVNGSVVGRIAYYVDDEGTKINLNSATGDRPTLNIGSSRSLSLSTVATANQSANFTEVINGNATSSNATSDIKNWSHFYRPEQVGAAISGFDTNKIPNLSAAPTGDRDYHTKKTPWGTDRLFINDLPTDTANATASIYF